LSNREKIAALDEALTVIRGVWAERIFSETGVHHQAVHVNLEPKPRQHIPLSPLTNHPHEIALAVDGLPPPRIHTKLGVTNRRRLPEVLRR
jgi:hypothetical protein